MGERERWARSNVLFHSADPDHAYDERHGSLMARPQRESAGQAGHYTGSTCAPKVFGSIFARRYRLRPRSRVVRRTPAGLAKNRVCLLCAQMLLQMKEQNSPKGIALAKVTVGAGSAGASQLDQRAGIVSRLKCYASRYCLCGACAV